MEVMTDLSSGRGGRGRGRAVDGMLMFAIRAVPSDLSCSCSRSALFCLGLIQVIPERAGRAVEDSFGLISKGWNNAR